ncbi:acyltransferase family protein [Microbacterium sp. A588]
MSVAVSLEVKTQQRVASSTFRPDIQGIRAFAVLAVVAEHLTGRPVGGFVGVDIFFVISGFLITGILAREFKRSGTISFRGFYRRRIKRILPAATLVLVVTSVLSFVLFTRENAVSTFWDALAAFFFVSNWRFAVTGTDYFAAGGLPSPLQHFWSLSVEEQFYFVWPWLMLAVLMIATMRFKFSRDRALRSALSVLMAVMVISFGIAMLQSSTDATVAYFSSATRVWELGVGGAIALSAGVFERIPKCFRTALAWVGVSGMVASVLFISSSLPFPGPWAALPVLSTAVVIVASIGTPARHNYLLVNPLARYFGDISYSLYLWHFPVIVFLAVVMPEQQRKYMVIALLVSIVLAAASYHTIERPFHKSPWLDAYPNPAARRSAWNQWWVRDRRSVTIWGIVAMLTMAVVIIGSAFYVTTQQRTTIANAVAAQHMSELAYEAIPEADRTAADHVGANVRAAIHSAEWPTLLPSVDTLLKDGMVTLPGCGMTASGIPTSCTFGDPDNPEIVVYGDSLGGTLLPTVVAAYQEDHFVRGLTRAACPMIPLDVTYPDSKSREGCESHQSLSIEYINESRPAVVLVIENYGWANRLESEAQGRELADEWTAAGEAFLESVVESEATVIFVTPPSRGKSITDCATAISTPADCVSTIDPIWPLLRDAEESIAGAEQIDTLHWFCTDAGFCPAFADGTPTKRDYVHPSYQYITSPDIVADFQVAMGSALASRVEKLGARP